MGGRRELVNPEKLAATELCLDFVNTLSSRSSGQPQETLSDPGRLAAWAEQHGLVDESTASQVEAWALSRPEQAATEHKAVMQAREALYALLTAHLDGKDPAANDLETFNRVLASAMRQARLVTAQGGFGWEWQPQEPGLGRLWQPVLLRAAELLTTPELLERLGRCAGEDCGWLFIDTSKNHSRKWCDIADCGNREKQRRYQGRKRRERNG